VRNFRLILEYDGRDFEGWQIQAGTSRTVQGCLAAAIEVITSVAPRITGSGRTDSGVHAEGQVASVRLETDLSAEVLRRALNGNLPGDVVVLEATEVGPEFDARRQATSKRYRYAIWNARRRSPLRAARQAHVAQRLDVEAMRDAAARLLGEHDFACFKAAGSDVESSVRSLFRLDVLGRAGAEIVLEVEGSGFLRHMVRNIAGTLIEVGRGKRQPDSLEGLLASRDRGLAGPTAPAHGLTLVWVAYGEAARTAPGARGGGLGDSVENTES
jgi:tRNA pseudouridine38-40 synthase